MTEYDVKQIIRKHEEENNGGCFGAILMLFCLGMLWYVVHIAGEDYTQLKERVKQLEAQVEKHDAGRAKP